jgi:hypothetical protein
MFQKMKYFKLVAFLGLAVVFLSGCGSQKENEKTTEKKTDIKNVSITTTPDLPGATGKVSDTVGALETSISAEDSIIAEDEANAKSAVTDEQETSDFNQVYNESEF